jgi:IS30 family transposase
MHRTFETLTATEREEISRGLEAGRTLTSIAETLERPTSTISREVQLGGGRDLYRALSAHKGAKVRKGKRKKGKRILFTREALRAYVHRHLADRWSPEQISVSLKEEYPHDMSMRISDEAIYQYLYVLPKGTLKKTLIAGLRQERKYRRKRKTGNPEETRGKIADMLSIEERPKEVEGRRVPGHWEGDTIVGRYRQSALGTLVERTTRYVMLVYLQQKDATSVRKAFAKEIRMLPAHVRKTLTYDQGKEMSEHKQFTTDTNMQVYFAHPGSPWERGTNENTNMLIRQYFPKGTDFCTITRREIKKVEWSLNGRPRKTLGWKNSREALKALLH